MDYLKVYPGEQKGTEDTYREQVKERIKVEEELGTGELPYGTALKVYTVGPHRVECKGMMLLELTFSPTRYGLGKLPVSSSCDLRLFFFFTIMTFYCTCLLIFLPKLIVLFVCSAWCQAQSFTHSS